AGGFSVYAARGGARSVTNLDISPHALAGVKNNFALNSNEPRVMNCRQEVLQADAFEWLAESSMKHFDLIILDPPSLAKKESQRSRALAAYGKLSELAIARLRRNGILVAASCSSHVSAEEFVQVVRRSALASGKKFRVAQIIG